ncbi:MAG: hypothetical protein LBU90_10390 [Bacteroidales bacterium]|jgi:hypothetical protein|nr:hypothetical protein [Bacteroidales bacterium]
MGVRNDGEWLGRLTAAYNAKKTIEEILASEKPIHSELYKHYATSLRRAVEMVYHEGGGEHLKANTNRFAAYKAYQATQIVRHSPDTAAATLAQFHAWQHTECATATARARTAKQWSVYMQADNLRLFPNLKWLPSTSVTQREEHRRFYHRVWAKNDPFWVSNTPGSLWRCKCGMQECADAVTDNTDVPEFTPPAGLEGNPGITGEIFTDKAGYIVRTGEKGREVVEQFLREQIEAAKPVEIRKFDEIIENIKFDKIEYNEVKNHSKQPTETEIIERIGGGDLTKGSCSSLAFAYAGNKCGYDVLDFRGGNSCLIFSRHYNIKDIAKKAGCIISKNGNDFTNAVNLIKQTEKGKEYYFTSGRHAAIIRKIDNGYEYLELQDTKDNGFKPLTEAALKERFKAKKSHTFLGEKYEVEEVLIDLELFKKDDSFRELLGYINTNKDRQLKGEKGKIK